MSETSQKKNPEFVEMPELEEIDWNDPRQRLEVFESALKPYEITPEAQAYIDRLNEESAEAPAPVPAQSDSQ